jgi:uncharacterized tellurite resistance protein B-like protein
LSKLHIPPKKNVAHCNNHPEWIWLGLGEQFRIGSYIIKDPLTYYSLDDPGTGVMTNTYDFEDGIISSSISYPYETDEASCLYKGLPIGTPLDEGKGVLGYWPRYSEINPNQRANYLEWLANDKKGKLTDMGYAFIFFYGLERRALLEKKDINLIIKIVIHLLGRYPSSNSFNSYLGSFIAYIIARVGITKFNEKWFNFIFKKTSIYRTEEGLAVILAWFHLNKKPLPLNWARRVAELDHRSSRSVVVKRVSEEFDKLFMLKYQNRFNQGMYLDAAKKDRAIYYTPASPTMPKPSHGHNQPYPIPEAVIPNVLGLEEQFIPLVEIWSECIDELKPLSRKVSKSIDPKSLDVFDALPELLKATTEHPLLGQWEKLMSSKRREDNFVFVKVSEIARLLKIKECAKLSAKQSSHVGETAGHIGYAVEPDFRITGCSYKWDDIVAFFRPQGKNILSENPVYLGASLLLELGLAVASADGFVDKNETAHIGGFLRSLFMLETIDYQRLEALKRVFIHQPPSLNNLSNRIKKVLPVSNLEKIGLFLIGVASSDGIIDPNEITVLKRIYKTLGIEKGKLDTILDSIFLHQKEPVVVKKGSSSKATGEKIPPREDKEPISVITINPPEVIRILEESKDLADVIGEIFQTNSEGTIIVDPNKNTATITVKTNSKLKKLGLDDRYHVVFINIIRRKTWQKNVLESLLKKHGYMIDATIEIMNDWAIEKFDDNMIFVEENQLLINLSILEKIKNENVH